MACAKHYALNSMENARFSVDVTIAPRPLHEIYLRHFKRAVEEGVASIMSAYNSVNGEWCGQNRMLLTFRARRIPQHEQPRARALVAAILAERSQIAFGARPEPLAFLQLDAPRAMAARLLGRPGLHVRPFRAMRADGVRARCDDQARDDDACSPCVHDCVGCNARTSTTRCKINESGEWFAGTCRRITGRSCNPWTRVGQP